MAERGGESPVVHDAPKVRTGGRSQQISDRVERATRDLLASGPVDGVTFEAIAERADVNRATLRRRWGNKWRLITWAALEAMSRIGPTPDTGSLQGDIETAMSNFNDGFGDPAAGALFQVLFVESRFDPAIKAATDEFWSLRLDVIRPIFDRARERHDIAVEVDDDLLFDIAFGPLFYHSLRTGAPVPPDYTSVLADIAVANLQSLQPPANRTG